jgi:hypothetical protein
MSDLEASKLAAIQAHAGVRHSDEYIDEALRQIEEKAKDVSDLLLATALMLPAAESACDIINGGVQFIRRRAHEALQPITFADPPDNGCITSPGEMAGNPSSAEYNDFHTRHAGS